MEYTFRKYTDKDYEFVYQLKKLCYQKYVDEYYGGWVEDVQRKMFANLMEKDGARSYIVIVNGQEAGFFSDGEEKEDSYQPNNLCLIPQFRGFGIGTDILKNIIEKYKGKNIYLKVFKSNPAQNLYKRLGFEVYDETPSHYLMKREREKNITEKN